MEREKMKYCPQCGNILTPKEIAGRERLACDSCNYVFWNNPVPVVAAIVEKEGRVLLAYKKDWQPGAWGLVAGFPEAGETLEEAVLREVREETGLEGEVLGLVGVYSLLYRNQVFIVYGVKAGGGALRVGEGEELETLKEFGQEELVQVLANLPPQSGAAQALRDWLRTQSEKSTQRQGK